MAESCQSFIVSSWKVAVHCMLAKDVIDDATPFNVNIPELAAMVFMVDYGGIMRQNNASLECKSIKKMAQYFFPRMEKTVNAHIWTKHTQMIISIQHLMQGVGPDSGRTHLADVILARISISPTHQRCCIDWHQLQLSLLLHLGCITRHSTRHLYQVALSSLHQYHFMRPLARTHRFVLVASRNGVRFNLSTDHNFGISRMFGWDP